MKTVRNRYRLVASSLALLLITAVARSAEGPSGAIAGRAQNVATGQYLNNVRISASPSGLTAITDQTGSYRLSGLAAGPVALEAFFPGLDTQRVDLSVRAGETVIRDFNLTSTERYGADATAAVKLDSFVVATSRDTDGASIALNEQRYSANIKNVVQADAMGDIMDGNIGEFLKFMPGITAEYDRDSGGSVSSVSVRGFPTAMAVVSSDGLQMASTGNTVGTSRVFQFTQVSINNIARLEVTKVPTPANPADSMAGSVDMVSKSAFERRTAELRYTFGISGNPRTMSLSRQPHLNDRREFKTLPSFTFDYTLPVTRNFGLVLTGQSQNRFIDMQWVPRTFNATAAGTGATYARPYLQSFQLVSVPRRNERNAAGVKADWRVTPNGVLSLSLERTRWVSERANAAITYNAGTAATPTVAGGVPLTFGDNFVSGATGRGAVNIANAGAGVHLPLETRAASVRYRHDDGVWRIVAAAGGSQSGGGYNDIRYGRFRTLDVSNRVPVRVSFTDIDDTRPGTIRVFDATGRDFDVNNLDNYQLTGSASQQRMVVDRLTNARLDVRRTLPSAPLPLALQAGALRRVQVRDARRESIAWQYNGPDGNPATPDSPTPYRMTEYVNQKEYFGFQNMPWVSTFKAWEAFQANPALFGQTPAQQSAQEQYRRTNSEWLREAVTSFYAQTEAGFFRNRLRLLAGVRHERTDARGQGVKYDPNAAFARAPDGSFLHTPAGAKIRRPEAGAAGSLQEVIITREERGYRAANSYSGSYPSAHLTFEIREGLLARAAYARTYGRPDLVNIVPNATIDETDFNDNVPDPGGIPGRISIRNTGLRPWTANNFDLSLEYYAPQGGLISAGAFRKELRNFFGSEVRIASPADLAVLGLEAKYAGWQLSTTFNQPGTARVTGVEFNLRQPLRPLGAWVRHFQVFANATKLSLDGSRDSDFSGFIPRSANWGVDFSRRPFNVMLKWNQRGSQRLARVAALGSDAYEYSKSRTRLDVNVDFQLRRNLFLYAAGQNVLNAPETLLRYGSETPSYARVSQVLTTGVQLSLGVKGTF